MKLYSLKVDSLRSILGVRSGGQGVITLMNSVPVKQLSNIPSEIRAKGFILICIYNMRNMKAKYQESKAAKVGDQCICPSCVTEFTKTNYQQAFCKTKGGTKCKDKYWNTVTPEKRNNTTRISPASAAWLASRESATSKRHKRPTIHPADVFGPWHDDDWSEADGGSGVYPIV